MTEAASLNFGPAWLRDSFTSNTASEGPPGIGGSGGALSHNSHQTNSGWDIATSRSSHGHGAKSNISQASNQSTFQMNLHVGGQQSSGTSSVLSAMKLAEYRYGREEMLALYPVGLQDTPTSGSALLLDEDILEAMETTSLLVPDRRAQPPLNLMGAVSEEEQRAWSRGANSDTSIRLYSKQKDTSGIIEGGRGRMDGGPLRGGPGDHRGGAPERGRGRGVGRGGGISAGGAFFDRHRSDDLADDPGIGVRGSSGSRGIGTGDGGRSFAGGRGRSFERSISGSWYSERSSGTGNGPGTAGTIESGGNDEVANNGSMSPRKGYTRAPFDDWRKPPTEREEEGEGGGWRSSGSGPSGRRWNAPSSSAVVTGSGTSQGWRNSDDGYRGGGKYDREFINGGGSSRWREDGPADSYFSRSTSRGGSGGAFSGSRGSFGGSSSFSRQRSRQDSDLPEWALDDDTDGRTPAGGTFDSSGKFRAPSSESPPPHPADNGPSLSPKSSPSSSRKNYSQKSYLQRNNAEEDGDGPRGTIDPMTSPFEDKRNKERQSPSISHHERGAVEASSSQASYNEWAEHEGQSCRGRGRGRGRQRQELRLLHGQGEQDQYKEQFNRKTHEPGEHDTDDEEGKFEDEEVDVDDLPPDVRKDTLEQRLQEQQQIASHAAKETTQELERAPSSGQGEKYVQHLQNQQQDLPSEIRQLQNHNRVNEMDDAMVGNLVASLVDDDSSATLTTSAPQPHHIPSVSPHERPNSTVANSSSVQQNQDSVLPGLMHDSTRKKQHPPQTQQETIWFYLDPQGNRQGPFSNTDMLEWFNAGYFPSELMLRRSIDKRFIQLAEMSKLYERVPFAPGPWPSQPPPLADLEELEKQQQQEAEKRHREQQQHMVLQQLQEQAILQQQLQIHQQRLFAIQQQHQGADKAALEQAVAAQAAAAAQSLQQQQQLMQKMMQNMSILQHPNANPLLAQQLLKEQHIQLPSSPGIQHDMQAELQFAKQQHVQQAPTSTHSEHPQSTHHQQPQHPGSAGASGLGGAFGIGLPAPVLKTRGATEDGAVNHNPAQSPQHSAISGLLGQQSSMVNPTDATSPSQNASYDPIKSLLNQLHQSDNSSSCKEIDSPSPSLSHRVGGLGIGEIHRTPATDQNSQQHQDGQLGGGTVATDSPHMGRSIWDMPAAAAAAPPTPNLALSREQQQHQLLHQQQQMLLQQNQLEQQKNAWGGPNLGGDERDQIHQSPESGQSLLQQQQHMPESSQYQQESYPSSFVHQQETTQQYEFQNQPEHIDNISQPTPADSFSTDSPQQNENNIGKNSNDTTNKLSSKEKKDTKRGKKETKRNEKSNNHLNNSNQQDIHFSADQVSTQNYIPGMEGTVRPEEPVTAAKSREEEQQRAQTDALYRLQIEQQQMLERERALAEEKAAKQRQESIQSASKLAPWAKKTAASSDGFNESNIHSLTSAHSHGEANLTLAEIQRLEQEREREQKIQREIEEHQLREQRLKQEAEEQLRRQQGKGMNWATTAAGGGPNTGKSLAEIQAEEAEQERERQERERQQKRARQKEMGLAQASVWGNASSNLSWASKAGSVGVVTPAASPAMPQAKNKQKQYGDGNSGSSSGVINSVPAPWSSAVDTNISGGFWDDAAQPPGLNNSSSQQNKKKKGNSKEVPKNSAKAAKEDAKVAQIFRENSARNTPRQNEFEAWCSSALANLNAQVDIPTFMAFLGDVESPYEVNDYVKNYIGEGKGPKNFAKEYLERRSKYKNSLKQSQKIEDDLLTPAQAINPNHEPDDGFIGGNGVAGSGSGGAGSHGQISKSKKKGKGSGKTGKFGDASHLLGFSVASARVNAGDIDLPQ